MWNNVFTKQVDKKEVEDVAVLLEKAEYFAALYQDTANMYQLLHS